MWALSVFYGNWKKKESKCLRSERSTSQNVPQIPNSQRIFERMMVISSQFCFTTKHCLLLFGLWAGWLYIRVSVSVWKTHGHLEGDWCVGWLSGVSQLKALALTKVCPRLLVRFHIYAAHTLSPRGPGIALCSVLNLGDPHLPHSRSG